MKAALARAGYSWLLRLLTPAYLARLWWRGRREPLYRLALDERLGLYRGAGAVGAVWIHAVSLGETRAARALVDALRRQRPGVRLLLTHGTATGRLAGAELLQAGDTQAWLPYDTPGAVRRFLQHHQPAVGVLMETEVWPNLLFATGALGVPMVLANARLSARSLAKGRRTQSLIGPAAAALARTLAQTPDDAQRLRDFGAAAVQVSGNLKFDLSPDPAQLSLGRAWRAVVNRPVVLFASSREGEEAALLRAWRALPEPRPLLLIVPRHPQRFADVQQLAAATLADVRCRSGFAPVPPADAALADAWIGDSLGEMALYYAMADVALLGGSFEPLGGQNLIEAAACACPMLMGPHTFNFAQAADDAVDAGAARRVDNIEQAVEQAAALARSPERAAMAQRAQAFAVAHRGAAERMASEVLALMPKAISPKG